VNNGHNTYRENFKHLGRSTTTIMFPTAVYEITAIRQCISNTLNSWLFGIYIWGMKHAGYMNLHAVQEKLL
jgi:hypothetical protein